MLMDGWMDALIVTKHMMFITLIHRYARIYDVSLICSWSIKDKAIWIADDLAKNNNRYHRYQSSAASVTDGSADGRTATEHQSQDSTNGSDDDDSTEKSLDNNITTHHQTESILDRLKRADGLDVGGSSILEMNMLDCLLLSKHHLSISS